MSCGGSTRGRGTRAAGVLRLVLAALVACSVDARGQSRPRAAARVQPEARADYINARTIAAHLGVGVSVPASTYVRLAIVGAAGQAWSDGSTSVGGRIDGLARFVVDPLRESRWAPYASGGISALYDGRERWRTVLVGVLGVEGPAAGRVVPAVEVGFGGGTRVGFAVRRAMPGRR